MRKAHCCENQEQNYLDPTFEMLHSRECMGKEIEWLKNNKHLQWNGIMSWDDRIHELQDAILKNTWW